jgi:hypothetical protein
MAVKTFGRCRNHQTCLKNQGRASGVDLFSVDPVLAMAVRQMPQKDVGLS